MNFSSEYVELNLCADFLNQSTVTREGFREKKYLVAIGFKHTSCMIQLYYISDVTYDISYVKYHLEMTWLIATSESKINGARKVTLMSWTVLI